MILLEVERSREARHKELGALRMMLTYATESADEIGALRLAKVLREACELAAIEDGEMAPNRLLN